MGNASAMTNMGEMYEDGRGVPLDLKIALKFYE